MKVFVLTMAVLAGVVSPIAGANAGTCWTNRVGNTTFINCN
jgi:hypothetical protein